MKTHGHQSAAARLGQFSLLGLSLLGAGTAALALTDSTPYSAISGRNAFALRPPPVVTNTPTVTPNPAPGIELQGFTTILGRPQVLLKLKLAPKPPEPAKDQSFVMDIGQIEGDVEIVSMDVYAGAVSLKNQGNLVSLNLKDNGAKPTAGPPLTAPNPAAGIRPTPPGLPNNPSAGLPMPAGGGANISTIGGRTAPTMPTRNLRTDPAGRTAGSLNSQMSQNDSRSLPLEVQHALIEVERERTRTAVENGVMPPLPPLNIPER